MRITALLMMLLAAVALVSCGKKEVRPPTQESKTALEAFALADKIKDAFMKKDIEAIRVDSTESGYKEVTANRKSYDSVELTFNPRWVEIEQDKVTLNIAWKSTWTAGGKETEDRGMAVFVMEGRPLKLSGILRTNPFTFPEQQYPRP
jgi:hypothetical protein